MNTLTSVLIPPALDTEVVTTREFHGVTCESLFKAFSDPQQLALWWGPQGFTNTQQLFDFRVGGHWHLTMHGPDGKDYANESRFIDIAAPERIVFEHLRPMHWFQMTMLMTPEASGARLTWRMRFETAAEAMKLGRFITQANQENFDRLHAHLQSLKSANG